MRYRQLWKGMFILGVSWPVALAGCDHEVPQADPVKDPAGAPDPDTMGENVVRSGDGIDVVIGDTANDFHVVNSGAIGHTIDVSAAREALAMVDEAAIMEQPVETSLRRSVWDSLVVGYPLDLLGEGAMFGGSITRVSVPDDEILGTLKMSQLPPVHVRPLLAPADGGGYALALVGCEQDCTETSPQEPLQTIPVLGFGLLNPVVYLDLAALGEGLTVTHLFEPWWFGLVEVASRTTFVDYSGATLVFDVETELVPEPDPEMPSDLAPVAASDSVFITMRWYLRLGSGFQDAFTPRELQPGIGYNTTMRSARPLITRFATTRYRDQPPVKYYIKNVPAEYRDEFSAALDDWNEVFRSLLGFDLLAYEFVDATDWRHPLLVVGDPRYNIIEWDVDNLAGYGGAAVAPAHQFTGEVLAGHVLIQGPKLLDLYGYWFGVQEEVAGLRAAGDVVAAEQVLVEGRREVQARLAPAASRTKIRIGRMDMIVPAEEPGLQNPVLREFDFDDTPPGVSFEEYMDGYFHQVVAHEVGHNLGLRHNFMGSLGGNGHDVATHSVMEYVARPERHLARVSEYDRQAIAYGYTGEVAEDLLPYCGDGDVASWVNPTRSAECSSHDAGSDPFGYFREERVRRAIDLVIGRGLGAAAPVWTTSDVYVPFWNGVHGMGLYATSAEATAHTWASFHLDPTRPTDPEDIRDYVLAEIQGVLCDQSIVDEILAKYALDPEAGALARDNWESLLWSASFLLEIDLGLPFEMCELLDELPF